MGIRLTALIVTICLCPLRGDAQTPSLSRQQRGLLESLITAVDQTAPTAAEPASWLLHVLRSSDGSHYVAFSLMPPALSDTPLMLYVRLATARAPGAATTSERSIVREWLAGSRIDPRLLPQRRGVAIGDMPAMGAGAIGARGASSVGSADLQAMNLERERARQRRDDDERRRKASLEGAGAAPSDLLPFEDFEVTAPAAYPDGRRAIERALSAGPGTYDLFVAWVEASGPPSKAQPQVAHRRVQLGAAAPDFGISSVIVADRIGARETPLTAIEQRGKPYIFGPTEIIPARDTLFNPAEQIAVAFQIVNPLPSASGKPDVLINLRIVKSAGLREEVVASLSPLVYDATTLPPDFDVRLGHPLIAALAAPLATIPRGDYRLVITAEDRLAAAVVSDATAFTVAGTPQSLLAEAPAPGARFAVSGVLQPSLINALLGRLAPGTPSPSLAAALQSARGGRFADLLVADAVPAGEQGIRTALNGLALLSLGNPSSTAEFQRALAQQAPPGPVQFLLGASHAMQGRDRDAIIAWEASRAAGLAAADTDWLIADAYLRQKDFARAAAVFTGRPAAGNTAAVRSYAATRIATGQFLEAVAALDALLASSGNDHDARWLLLHALYADFVGGNRAVRARLATEAQRYIDQNGTNAALAAEWMKIVTSS